MRFKNATAAKAEGMRYAIHVLNQPDSTDNGWHYFETRAEAEAFVVAHPDRLNPSIIDTLSR